MLGGMKVFSCRAMGMNVKRRLYEGVAEKRFNVMERRRLKSTYGVTKMERVNNDELNCERELVLQES